MTRYDEFLEMQAQETDDCILWPYATNGRGYGAVWFSGKVCKTHRLSCEIAHGAQPGDGSDAAHSCRNRHCFNPRHLRWATRWENLADKVKDGTSPRGTRNHFAKVSEYQVREMRIYLRNGVPQKDLAAYYNVTRQAVGAVANGYSWKWLV